MSALNHFYCFNESSRAFKIFKIFPLYIGAVNSNRFVFFMLLFQNILKAGNICLFVMALFHDYIVTGYKSFSSDWYYTCLLQSVHHEKYKLHSSHLETVVTILLQSM